MMPAGAVAPSHRRTHAPSRAGIMKQTGAIEGMDQHGAQYGADAAPMGDLAALLVLFRRAIATRSSPD
jgi:hypothetical protein